MNIELKNSCCCLIEFEISTSCNIQNTDSNLYTIKRSKGKSTNLQNKLADSYRFLVLFFYTINFFITKKKSSYS